MIRKFTSIEEVNNLTKDDIFKPQIAVIGIGGAGSNALNNMIELGLSGVKFVVINTDAQSLENSVSPNKIQIGPKVTKGLGAGSKPEIGSQAAEESIEDIKHVLENINMLFIACGMGGGTGTGASQVVAKIAKEMGILTVAFVTTPFDFEGNQRSHIATSGVAELEKYVDSMLVISNENLFNVVDVNTSVLEAFRIMDGVLFSAVKSIVDLISASGLVNLDFNDIKSVLEGAGRTMIGSAEAEGENRAEIVVKSAIINPLLEDTYLKGAKKALINITGGEDMTLYEVNTIIKFVKQELFADAFINFGTVYDNSMGNKIRLSIVATGLEPNVKSISPSQKINTIATDKVEFNTQQKDVVFKPKVETINPQLAKDENLVRPQPINRLREQNFDDRAELRNSIPMPEITPEVSFSTNFNSYEPKENDELIRDEILKNKQEQIRKLKESKKNQPVKPVFNNQDEDNMGGNDFAPKKELNSLENVMEETDDKNKGSLFDIISKLNNTSSKDNQNRENVPVFNPKIKDRNNSANDSQESSLFDFPSFLKKK